VVVVVGVAVLKAGTFMILTWPEDGPSICMVIDFEIATIILYRPMRF